ncbi:hypothetical protein [Ollibium composti]|uniref:Uncharacterized protein n=1 Tax=Ollibium composti TaxID=2675109 RepID=A0ABY2QBB9_9HYPH|nr:hypothetical protein [Mesorhizobium composti]THF59160.1 hypothetical protein E6C48_05810 [Mesorhizobium composti]
MEYLLGGPVTDAAPEPWNIGKPSGRVGSRPLSIGRRRFPASIKELALHPAGFKLIRGNEMKDTYMDGLAEN